MVRHHLQRSAIELAVAQISNPLDPTIKTVPSICLSQV